ncbi:hypothetical protein [Mycolicibacterium mageritense]|nr:hypothetical protein [Mycolicibacterium mageritense]MCC9184116.1 hypothetical protein [Mycolicibacterium mageritense]
MTANVAETWCPLGFDPESEAIWIGGWKSLWRDSRTAAIAPKHEAQQ